MEALGSERQNEIVSAMTRREFSARRLIVHQGEQRTSLHVVESGSVRLFYTSLMGHEFTTKVTGKGGVVGIVAAVSGIPPAYSAQSLEPVVVRTLSAATLLTFMENIPRFAVNISRILAKLYDGGLQRNARIIDSVDIRLIKVLYELAIMGSDGCRPVSASIRGVTQSDLATMVGASRPWVSLTLTGLEKRGLLVKQRGVIVIPDIAALGCLSAGLFKSSAPPQA